MEDYYQMIFLAQYCDLIDKGLEFEYKLKGGITLDGIPSEDLERLKEIDESFVLLYGKHMIPEFE